MEKLKLVSVLILFTLCFSCKKEQGIANNEIPTCIQSMIDDNEDLLIHKQEVDGQIHYWINTGANAVDGNEQIVNIICVEVCYYGGWINPDCLENYVFEDWEQINP